MQQKCKSKKNAKNLLRRLVGDDRGGGSNVRNLVPEVLDLVPSMSFSC